MGTALWTVIKKELRRVFTDKRLVITSFIMPAVFIFIMYSMIGRLTSRIVDETRQHIPNVYISNIPNDFKEILNEKYSKFINWNEVKNNNIETIKKYIKDEKVDLLIVFDEDFENQVINYKDIRYTPQIMTYYNSSSESSSYARWNIFKDILDEYEKFLLGKRFGKIEYANVFDIDRTNEYANVVDEKKETGKYLSRLLPMLVAVFLFAGAMQTGMDAIAGEKERGTMATMLVTPVKREALALGKIISLGIIALISAGSSFLGVILSLPYAASMYGAGDEQIDIASLHFGISEYFELILIMITLTGVYVGIICLLSVIARNVKEASSFIVPIYFIVMILGFVSMFTTAAPPYWQYFIPVHGNILAIKNLLLVQLSWANVLACSMSCIVFTLILVYIITKLFNNERVMFNT